jgi:hypothetical protein
MMNATEARAPDVSPAALVELTVYSDDSRPPAIWPSRLTA